MYLSIVSSRFSSPSSANCNKTVTTTDFVTLRKGQCISLTMGSSDSRSATPRSTDHAPSGVVTVTAAPGTSYRSIIETSASSKESCTASGSSPLGCDGECAKVADGVRVSPSASTPAQATHPTRAPTIRGTTRNRATEVTFIASGYAAGFPVPTALLTSG